MNIVSTLLLTGAVMAQTASSQDQTAALKESLAENQGRLRKYPWIETTQVSRLLV